MGPLTRRASAALLVALAGCDDAPTPASDAARADAIDDINFPSDAAPLDAPAQDAVDVVDVTDVAVDAAPRNAIVRENARPGTGAWQITHPSEHGEVEGYASVVSVAPGDAFALRVNVSEARDVAWEAYRMGYYDGEGGRLVTRGEAVRVSPQAPCSVARETGMVECHWDTTFTVVTDASWVTGLYLLKLVRDDGFESWVPMVLREATPRAPLVLQAAVNTWQAYNDWGGASLYVNGLPAPAGFTGDHGYRVSFDRPYSTSDQGSGQLLWWEVPMARWLERRGYDVAYTTNVDVDAAREPITSRRMFITAGHDEYWTMAERDALDRARDLGVSLGFFSADTGTFHVRYAPSSDGDDRRTIVCYKVDGAAHDPARGTGEQTTRFAEPPLSRPENALLGVMYAQWTGGARFPMVVRDPSHWIFDGTHVEAGDTLASIVGSEYDRVHDNGRSPKGLEVVAASPGVAVEGAVDLSHAAVYYPTPSSLVFAAGTLSWSLALGRSDVLDARVQRMTENILAHAGLPVDAFTEVAPRVEVPLPARVMAVTVLAGDGTVLKPDPYAPSRQNRVDDLIPRARSRVCCHGRNLPSRTECLIRRDRRPQDRPLRHFCGG